MSIATVTPNEEALRNESLTIVEQSKIVIIRDQESYNQATDLLLKRIQPFRKQCKEYFDSMREPAYRAYKAIMERFSEADGPLELAERHVKSAILTWDQEQERRRQQLQREAEEAARKAEEARMNAASVAEDLGASEEEVEAIANSIAPVVAEPIAPLYQRASGVSTRDNWSARVVDIKKLCAGVAKGTVPISYVEPNMTALNARARADRQTMNVVGVVAVNTPVVSGRSSR
jgi:hypothetical protein